MTIAEIRTAQNALLDEKAGLYGEHAELTAAQNVEVTDAGAAAYDDVNPDHKYPPVNK